MVASRNVLLRARLTDDNGNPIGGKTIYFYYRSSGAGTWTSLGSSSTGSDGYASLQATVTAPGTYDFKAEFPGDDTYDSSSDVKTVTVKAKTVLSLTVSVS